MAMQNKLHIVSFNCEGVKTILHLCEVADIILLQETWLFPHEFVKLSNIHPSFHAFSLSSMDMGTGLVVGRPRGGLSILWRKSLSHLCKIVQFDDERILGLSLHIGDIKFCSRKLARIPIVHGEAYLNC